MNRELMGPALVILGVLLLAGIGWGFKRRQTAKAGA